MPVAKFIERINVVPHSSSPVIKTRILENVLKEKL
jgi:hypothetical protein